MKLKRAKKELERVYELVNQYTQFVVGGMFTFLLEIIMTVALTEIYHVWFVWSYFISLFIGTVAYTIYNRNITFQIAKKTKCFTDSVLSCITTFFLYLINIISVSFASTIIPLHYTIIIMMMAPVFSIASFYINKAFMV